MQNFLPKVTKVTKQDDVNKVTFVDNVPMVTEVSKLYQLHNSSSVTKANKVIDSN